MLIGRIVRSADFERVLGTPVRARSAHFALHHLDDVPSRPARATQKAPSAELSTGLVTSSVDPVDEKVAPGCWLGAVVPKRHARRAATRNLLKRQIRQMASSWMQREALPRGLWVVRLRQPFDVKKYPSAASTALREDAHDELSRMFADAVRRLAA